MRGSLVPRSGGDIVIFVMFQARLFVMEWSLDGSLTESQD